MNNNDKDKSHKTTNPTIRHDPDTWLMQRPDLLQMTDWTDADISGTATAAVTTTFVPDPNGGAGYVTWPTITAVAQPSVVLGPAVAGPATTLQSPFLDRLQTIPANPEPTWIDKAQKVKHAYTFLETAVLEMKDRAAQRDTQDPAAPSKSGERSMAATIKAFNALTGHDLTEEEGWEFMILLKLVRGRQGDFRPDDYVDAAAYSGLLGECASKIRGK